MRLSFERALLHEIARACRAKLFDLQSSTKIKTPNENSQSFPRIFRLVLETCEIRYVPTSTKRRKRCALVFNAFALSNVHYPQMQRGDIAIFRVYKYNNISAWV